MIAYIDSSVLLRIVLCEPNRLSQWNEISYAVSSALLEVETLRTLDRLHVRGKISADTLSACWSSALELISTFEIVDLSKPVLSRASSPFPTTIGTLDAIHLSTALLFKDFRKTELTFTTHDNELAVCARSMGLSVLG